MTRATCAVLAAVLASGPVAGRAPAAQQTTFRAATDVVEIDVGVFRRNRPITSLVARDFEVTDNGVPQRPQVEAAASVPVDVSLLISQYWITQWIWGARIADDVVRMADLLRSTDRLGVIGFATDVSELVQLQSAATWASGTPPEVLRPLAGDTRKGRLSQAELDLKHTPRWAYQSLSDAVLLALARRAEIGRRHLVVVLMGPSHDVGGVASLRVPLAPIAARSDALVEVAMLLPSDPVLQGSPGTVWKQFTDRNIAEAVAATGGSVHNVRDGVAAFKSILEGFRQRYVLRYTATDVDPGGWHEITVRVPAHPEYEVRARRGYLGR